ncbi:MAG: hypothetical protein U0234_00940 [Sandaracinus sp.]
MRPRHSVRVLSSASLLALVSACQPQDLPTGSYYEDQIQPVFLTSCVRQNTGCHVATPQGTATGNLDISSFDALMHRRDVLDPYGPYPLPLLLMKAGDPVTIHVETFGETDGLPLEMRQVDVTTDVRHAGGSTVDFGTSGFSLISQWVRAGHTRTGSPSREVRVSEGPCRSGAGSAPGYDPAAAPGPDYAEFRAQVNPVLRETCAGAVCHGNPHADLYLSCGDTDAEVHWNHWVAMQFVSESASVSELLRRPLAKDRGGTYHEGGTVLPSTDDSRYQAIFHWAQSLTPADVAPVIPPGYSERGLRFFANRVQPVMVRKGCMFLNCHSPSMFHDLRLRGGSGGHFGRVATIANYDMARLLLAVDAEDPNESRLIAKNLYPDSAVDGGQGIIHRGGSLLDDFPPNADGTPHTARPADCDAYTDDELDRTGDLNTIPAYCIFVRWHEIEREEVHPGLTTATAVTALVWVNRPAGVGRPEDFDTYRPGASLRIADATLSRTVPLALSNERDLASGCGFPAGAADIRGPAATYDGTAIAFAARTSAATPYRLYRVALDGSGCAPIPGIAPASDSASGILLHDFDPAYAPDGRLVFASTRGYLTDHAVGRAGPTRTPASLAPNANLFVQDADGSIRQLTYLLNQEIQPSFMLDGRIIMTAEKRELEFHQLAGRRLNLDGGDYHPLYAQRESIGYRSATEVGEMLDRNFILVAGELDTPDGAGSIAIINRSIGPDQSDRDPTDRAYIHSMRFPVPGALEGGTGAFRSPTPLPNGHLVVSCDLGASSLAAGSFAFHLCDLNPDNGDIVDIGGGSGANVEAVAVFPREAHEVFQSNPFEANGHTEVVPGEQDATIIYSDLPMIATLLFANTRTGRPISSAIGGFDVLESLPPPDGVTSFSDGSIAGSVQMDAFGQFYASRRMTAHADLASDGSAIITVRGGMSVTLRATDHDGHPLMFPSGGLFTGEIMQREAVQFYPGEHNRQSIPRNFFNGLCGGCHGAITNRELDVAVEPDVLTRASPHVQAIGEMPVDAR